jgi:hypothetical protein
MAGANERQEGCTNSSVPIVPSVSAPQSLPQDLLERSGPTGPFHFAWRQQHVARFRQQEELDALSGRAASGASQASENSTARQAAITERAKRKLSRLPSILGKSVSRAQRYNGTSTVTFTSPTLRPQREL